MFLRATGRSYFDDLGQYVFGQVVKATRRKQRPSTFNPESKLIAVDDATKKGIGSMLGGGVGRRVIP